MRQTRARNARSAHNARGRFAPVFSRGTLPGDSFHLFLFHMFRGEARNTAVRDMARLVSNALQHSCSGRDQRNSLIVVSAHLLAYTPALDGAAPTTVNPWWHRVLRGFGGLLVAGALFAGTAVFPSSGAATDVMAVASLMSVAAVFPPLRELLGRAMAGFFGSAAPRTEQGAGPNS
ncbi:hypothetical protein [Streptomyces sp. NPDC059928]|uniref:hypothetical protein n=1 Tax=unclassified Streptomyces TaxID=2593676 RepID=UPI00366460AF